MPEGPPILILKDRILPFKNKVVKDAGGYGDMPTDWLKGKKLLEVRTWGKHLLLVFEEATVRIHLGLFGSVLINERRKSNRKFYLEFPEGEINGYIVNAKKICAPDEVYDWRTDVMSRQFDKKYVKELIRKKPDRQIDDILMDQEIFSGVGNKIRNEALYRAGIHPESIVSKIPDAKLTKLINEVVKYAKLFYENLKKEGKNNDFSVYKQEFTPDGSEVTMKTLRKTKRKIYFSEHDQVLYS